MLGTWVYYYALAELPWQTIAACTLVPFCGYTLGIGAAQIFKQSRDQTITIALETGFQNLALAMFMISTSLDPPESDFAGVVPVCYTYMASILPVIAVVGHLVNMAGKTCHSANIPEDDVTEMANSECSTGTGKEGTAKMGVRTEPTLAVEPHAVLGAVGGRRDFEESIIVYM